jgi:hypothetical protein
MTFLVDVRLSMILNLQKMAKMNEITEQVMEFNYFES